MPFKASISGINLIKQFEACRLTAYQDGAGVWTIGYGSTRIHGQRVYAGQVITLPEALDALQSDVAEVVAALNHSITVELNQNQADAVTSLTYNIGVEAFRGSTICKCLNTGSPIIEDYFTRWNKIRNPITGTLEPSVGLTRRRQMEYQLFIKGI